MEAWDGQLSVYLHLSSSCFLSRIKCFPHWSPASSVCVCVTECGESLSGPCSGPEQASVLFWVSVGAACLNGDHRVHSKHQLHCGEILNLHSLCSLVHNQRLKSFCRTWSISHIRGLVEDGLWSQSCCWRLITSAGSYSAPGELRLLCL